MRRSFLLALFFLVIATVNAHGVQVKVGLPKILQKVISSYQSEVSYSFSYTHTSTSTHVQTSNKVSTEICYKYQVDVQNGATEHTVNVKGNVDSTSSVCNSDASAVVEGQTSKQHSCQVTLSSANIKIKGSQATNPLKISYVMCGTNKGFVYLDGFRYYSSKKGKWKRLGAGKSMAFLLHEELVEVSKAIDTHVWTVKACGITINFNRGPEIFEPHPVDIFGNGVPEWHLAFRGTASIDESVYDAYLHGSDDVELGCKQVKDPSLPCSSHYRSSIMDEWKYIDEVAFVVYKAGVMQKYAVFNGKGTDHLSWFCPNELKFTNWCKLKDNQQFFSIVGHDDEKRRFFINGNYGGCGNDAGWFVAVDSNGVSCEWEKFDTFPTFLYSTTGAREKWSCGKVAKADVIAVYVKYAKIEELPLVDVFNTKKAEWRLVFRGTSRINQPVHEAFFKGSNHVEAGCKQIDGRVPCSTHYRSLIMDYWTDIDEVAVVLYRSGEMKKYLLFNGKGSNNQNWFDRSRMVSAQWHDLNGKPQFFSLNGDANISRRFFINYQYKGCENDTGWLVVLDQSYRPCSWEGCGVYPVFLYADSGCKENWTTGKVAEADVMAIFVKFKSD